MTTLIGIYVLKTK